MGVTWIVTPGVILLAQRLGAVDRPGVRKVHQTPIPRIGGLAVFLGFIAGLVFAAFATGNLFSLGQVDFYWRGLALAATGLLLVGLVDDLRGLSFKSKFLAQIVAATFVFYCGFRIETITHPLGGQLDLGWASFPATVFWIVGITNAVNLIDGLDGLAAGTALITTSAVAVIALFRGELGVTAASVALAGSLIGFLRFNFNPARIFLGDSGSLFLGFVLGVTSVRGSQKGPTVVAVLFPLLVLALPLLDTGLAVIRRLMRVGNQGRSSDNKLLYMARNLNMVFLPDRGHIHHRLIDYGMSHRGAVLCLWAFGATFAGLAFILVLSKSLWVGLVLALALLAALASLAIATFLRLRRTRSEESAQAPLGAAVESLSASGTRLRR
jgi:UDP-GlcNAc:undecaprenyl-phosphate GlcNAc-1-phosphate transferase